MTSQQWESRSLLKNPGVDKTCFQCAGSLTKSLKILMYPALNTDTRGTKIMTYWVCHVGTQGVNSTENLAEQP